MFSGGSYDDVARWLRNFLTSHVKREHPRMEVVLETGDDLDGRAYRARVRFGEHSSTPLTLEYREVADNRGTLAWCAALAAGVRALARTLLAAVSTSDAHTR